MSLAIAMEPGERQGHEAHQDGEDNRLGRGKADVELRERGSPDLEGGHGRVEARATEGQSIDEVEELEGDDDAKKKIASSVGASIGSVMCRRMFEGEAPSTRAASTISSGSPCNAA